MKLFCFPYAGGSSAIFNNWKAYISDSINIRAIELAGRGKRIHENHYNDIHEAIQDIFTLIKDEIQEGGYAFFGHSMGAKLSYELAHLIQTKGMPMPKHIFFSGRGAPYVPGIDEKEYHTLPDEEFKKEIIKLGGTPKEFFDHPELLEVFLPLLKNDFKLAARDKTKIEITPLPFDITVFLGKDEELTAEQADSWKKHTTGLCTIHYFNGGHFFINDHVKELVEKINNTIYTVAKK